LAFEDEGCQKSNVAQLYFSKQPGTGVVPRNW
jgi:hypothetical protein